MLPGMTLAGIVLAAGSSTRMGRPKQLLPVRGRPLLEHVVAAACASRLDSVLVVLGADAELISGRVRWGRALPIVNPDYRAGMSTSLRAGIDALGPEVEGAVVILGDQLGVSARLLDRLIAAREGSGSRIAALRLNGLLQPPVLLVRELWGEVSALRGDVGLRDLIRCRPELVAAVGPDAGAGDPGDVDTPEDWWHRSGAG